ncbi:MAG: precorrin-3B C(17)-methyltransferase [Candidatus Bathyarchaeia archaeon]
MTPKARQVIEEADVIIGYKTYVELINSLIKSSSEVIVGLMRQEVERARIAVGKALANKKVAVISSGDPGVYGMASIVFEVAALEKADIPIEVVPGVTAATAAAAKLGAPLTSDFAVISLSDLLTPWELIEKRLDAAAAADFVIVLYNPRSNERTEPLIKAYDILCKYRSPETPVGVVKNLGRAGETATITTLKMLLESAVDMATTVIVGNSLTRVVNQKMITPRGYNLHKFSL